ncbi:MAG: glycosyltransferase family 2 protein [Cyanobacterium sp. T60_A2020_053]|nr:glycosyltransferase family 2 protein [Cyanobacterium sp. T60_A2020_053]
MNKTQFLDHVTPLILTYNEEANIQRTLQRLTWAKEIVIIDSYSNDKTLEIIAQYPQCRVIQRTFDTHAQQWNFGLDEVKTEWVLTLDADYILSEELLTELKSFSPSSSDNGYSVGFKYCVFGHPLRKDNLTPRIVLFKNGEGRYIDDGHTQILQLQGEYGTLKSIIYHDDRKSVGRWLWAQDRYLNLETEKLRQTSSTELDLRDKIRQRKVIAPFIIFFYCLFYKQLIFDGWRGLYYTFQRTFVELLLSIKLMEYDLKQK